MPLGRTGRNWPKFILRGERFAMTFMAHLEHLHCRAAVTKTAYRPWGVLTMPCTVNAEVTVLDGLSPQG